VSTELEEKTERLRQLMSEKDLTGILINSQPNFAWLTCGGRNGIDQSRENGAASILVTSDGKRYVLANNIEMPRVLAEELLENEFEPVEFRWQDEKADPALVSKTAVDLAGSRVGSETEFENQIASCRYSLTAEEIERYRGICRDAGDALGYAALNVIPGTSEIAVAERMRAELAGRGLAPVVTLVAADDRIAKFRHPVPTEKRWEKVLLMVTCARRNGLIASLSRMICFGNVPDELQKKTEAAAYVNASLLDATRPGVSGADLYRTAANAYAERGVAGEAERHHQGGAAGYRTRDWVAHPQSIEVVQQDQAFAWNPSITGTKVEETCVVGEDGVEILTASPDLPQIANIVNGTEYVSPGILIL
jgi:antitoxin VapB